ncbi:MAG: DUF1295 domain-containing protein [Bacteroidetes bacterium]|nr:DUF1295 domain-containing protein [Bacteroidota bacterium]
MIRTAAILITTLIVLPIIAFTLDTQSLSDLQWTMLQTSALIALIVAFSCFALAEWTGNCSQVDKIWSIVPMVYVWYFAFASGWNDRIILMACCVTIWGLRLTYNFSRHGGYRWRFWEGEEDYRWEVLRQNHLFKGHTWRWRLFNLFFISLYQNTLIWLFTLPAMMAYVGKDKPLNWFDWLVAVLFVGFVVVETVADQQQWDFQQQKKKRLKSGEKLDGEYANGFVSSGLWSLMRHPNYASEQAVWLIFYLFTISAGAFWMNWSMTGSLLLLILFQSSSDFSETISASKYPAYTNYQKTVSRFIPKLW